MGDKHTPHLHGDVDAADAVDPIGIADAFEVVDDEATFFAPVSSDAIDSLLGSYQAYRARITRLAETIREEADAVGYFLAGNVDDRRYGVPAVAQMFDAAGAVAALNSSFWGRALALTDVYDFMPQARRDEWNKSLRENTAPDFDAQTVRPALSELLASRHKFFAERVDGIFRGLSGEHVTNAPEAFGRRMIIAHMWSGFGPFTSVSCSRAGLINDLRCVVAKFMGRDEPKHYVSDALLESLRREIGVWHTIDGGAIRIRVYKKGTAHLEVHPDMAWRLNSVLASLYPAAIPAQFRQRPAKRLKAFEMIGRPLPFAVLELLPRPHRRGIDLRIDRGGASSAVYDEAVRVIEAIGGTVGEGGWCQFDYRPDDVLLEIALTGCIPDRVAHQFYPTPERLACEAAEAADIGPQDQVLEPSAGQGHLAAQLPKDRTTCIEVAPLHCAILKARGFNTIEADFLEWAREAAAQDRRFDRVVMNPPFSEGRARAHTEAAAGLVRAGGRLVAILPAPMRGKTQLDGFDVQWSRVYEREFAGTSAAVSILTASRAEA